MKIWIHCDKLADLCGGKGPMRKADNFVPVSPAKFKAVKWKNVEEVETEMKRNPEILTLKIMLEELRNNPSAFDRFVISSIAEQALSAIASLENVQPVEADDAE